MSTSTRPSPGDPKSARFFEPEGVGPGAPASPAAQAWIFQRLRWEMLRHTLAGRIQGSVMRVVVILLCSLLIWGGVYAVSAAGFHFLQQQHITLGGTIVRTIFDLLFLCLGVLLIFSTGIILYSSLFSSAESNFLLSLPARADQVFAYKYQGAIAFSSWAFILLGSPVLVAYGVSSGAPWYYYPLVVLYFLGFVLLPGSLGALACLLVVNLLPRRPKQILALSILLVVVGLGVWVAVQVRRTIRHQTLDRDFIQQLWDQLALARAPLAPNHWLTRGLQAAAREGHAGEAPGRPGVPDPTSVENGPAAFFRDLGLVRRGEMSARTLLRERISPSVYCLALVWSNGLFAYVLTAWAASRLYRRGYNRVSTGAMLRRRYAGHWLDYGLSGVVAFLDRQTRLLIVKDFRTFRRDPAQWAQILILAALSTLYFTNVRRFYNEEIGRSWKNPISFVNLAATALLLCAYTGRFIYPMLSLEGRKFWILGLLPLPRERLLAGKFAFSATWTLLVAEFLAVFCNLMLAMPPIVIVLHALAGGVIALGLSGLSVGLGAWMPNFRESDPSKIAVGFGGTLNLVVCLLFLIVVIALMVAPIHLWALYHETFRLTGPATAGVVVAAALGLAVGVAAVVLPLRLGARALKRMEF